MRIQPFLSSASLIALSAILPSCSDNESHFLPDDPDEVIRSEMIFITDSTDVRESRMLTEDDNVWWEFYTDENGNRIIGMPMREATCSFEELNAELEAAVNPYAGTTKATRPILTTYFKNLGSYWEVGIKYCRLEVIYQTDDIYRFPRRGYYRARYQPLPNEIPLETVYLPSGNYLSVIIRIHDKNDGTDLTKVSYIVGFRVEIRDKEYVLASHNGIDHFETD